METFVINLDYRQDRWEKMQKRFKNTSLRLTRWSAVNGKNLNEEYIKKVTTTFCNYFCSHGMIGCWLSHYFLWKYIVENKLDKVLVLEDDAIPIDNFDEKFNSVSKKFPKDWDLIYLGCGGTCTNNATKLDIITPVYPLSTYAYMISYNGAKKLIESDFMKYVFYHIDAALGLFYNIHKNFKMYAVANTLIHHKDDNPSDIANGDRPTLSRMVKQLNINPTSTYNLDSVMNIQIVNLRKLGLSVNVYFILFAIISFVLGMMGNKEYIYVFIFIVFAINATDLYFGTSILRIAWDFIIICVFLLIGFYFKSK
jgi:GR25 family glycosyltransferase involved in LPS biosynthesis